MRTFTVKMLKKLVRKANDVYHVAMWPMFKAMGVSKDTWLGALEGIDRVGRRWENGEITTSDLYAAIAEESMHSPDAHRVSIAFMETIMKVLPESTLKDTWRSILDVVKQMLADIESPMVPSSYMEVSVNMKDERLVRYYIADVVKVSEFQISEYTVGVRAEIHPRNHTICLNEMWFEEGENCVTARSITHITYGQYISLLAHGNLTFNNMIEGTVTITMKKKGE